jgi:hypothetical protein
MTDRTPRPLLFLDVDGPLLPFQARPPRLGDAALRATAHPGFDDPGGHPFLDRLNPEDGPRLAALGCEPVWATAWMDDANDSVAPRIGLPSLPVVNWVEWRDEDERLGLHWKTRTLVEYAAGRPFAWIDDELTGADRDWVSVRHPGPALLHQVDPWLGLTEADFVVVEEWVRGLSGAA